MPTLAGLMVRGSGRFPGRFYIDLEGQYALGDIAETTGFAKEHIEAIYRKNGAVCEQSLGVFFFPSRETALDALHELEALLAGASGKTVFLTHEEIDYIRQTLINEGSNVISVRNELKRRIFDKFNR